MTFELRNDGHLQVWKLSGFSVIVQALLKNQHVSHEKKKKKIYENESAITSYIVVPLLTHADIFLPQRSFTYKTNYLTVKMWTLYRICLNID